MKHLKKFNESYVHKEEGFDNIFYQSYTHPRDGRDDIELKAWIHELNYKRPFH